VGRLAGKGDLAEFGERKLGDGETERLKDPVE